VLANTNLCDHFNSAVPKAWVAAQTLVVKGRKMGHPEVIEICQNELFSFHISSSFPIPS